MKYATKYHNEVDIKDEELIHFPQGIPSFLEEKSFFVLPFAENSPFYILQSAQTPALAFVIVSPFDFFSDYSAKISDQNIEALQIENKADVLLFVILTIQEPFSNTTANLQGPIVINSAKKIGKQVILSDSPYQTKHKLTDQKVTSSAGGED